MFFWRWEDIGTAIWSNGNIVPRILGGEKNCQEEGRGRETRNGHGDMESPHKNVSVDILEGDSMLEDRPNQAP